MGEWDLKMNSIKDAAKDYRDKILEALGFVTDGSKILGWSIENVSPQLKAIGGILAAWAGINFVVKLAEVVGAFEKIGSLMGGAVGKFFGIAIGTGISFDGLFRINDAVTKISNGLGDASKNWQNFAGGLLESAAGGALIGGTIGGPKGALIGAGVGALIGAFDALGTAIYNAFSPVDTEMEKLKTSIETNKKSLDNYKQTMSDLADARQEFLDKSLSELDYYERLYQELQFITDENGNVKDGYEERAKFIVTTLSSALGIEIDLVDGVITKNKELEDKIYDVIDAKRAQYLLESHEAEYNEAKNQRVTLEGNYATAIENTKAAEEKRNQALQEMATYLGISTEELTKFIDENGRVSQEKLEEYSASADWTGKKVLVLGFTFQDLNNKIVAAEQTFRDSDTVLANSRDAMTKNEEVIYDFENAITGMKDKNYKAVLGIYEDTHTYLGKNEEETYNNYQRQITMQEDYLRYLDENKDKYDEDYIKSEKTKTEAVIKNLKDEQAQYKSSTEKAQFDNKKAWLDNIAGIISDLTGKNVEFKTVGRGQVQFLADGIEQGSPMAIEDAEALMKDVLAEVNVPSKFENAAKEILRGVGRGVKNKDLQEAAKRTMRSFASDILSSFKQRLGIASPSKETKKVGMFLLEGLIVGIDEEEKTTLNRIKSFGASIIGAFDNSFNVDGNVQGIANAAAATIQDGLYGNASLEATSQINYGEIAGAINSNVSINSGNLANQIAAAVSTALQETNVNVNIEAKTEEGILVKKVADGFNQAVRRTGSLPFTVPI
jgi:hypothetical protein